MNIDLGYVPREWQREMHDNRKRFAVLAVHRRAGKTEAALMELVDSAIRCTNNLGLYFYVAPLLKQARAIAWARLKEILRPLADAGAVEFREGDLTALFRHNGAAIRLYGADNPDAMRGVRLDGVVMDEVAQMRPETWHEIVQPALSDRLGWALFIGTPKGIDLFSELFHRAVERQSVDDPDWFAARFDVSSTHALTDTEIARLQAEMSPTSYAREFLCDFSASGDDQLIGLAEAEEAAGRNRVRGDIEHAPRIVGVDPARFGNDRSVIVRRQGLCMYDPDVRAGIDNMSLADRVANVIASWRPNAVFIDAGAGSGVIDRLRQMGHSVVEVPFGGKATTSQFHNRRAQMWWEMREWLRSGGAIPRNAALKQELAAPTYSYDSQGRVVLESKDSIRKRLHGAGSPDIADALALTFAAPVSKRGTGPASDADYREHMRRMDVGLYSRGSGLDAEISDHNPFG